MGLESRPSPKERGLTPEGEDTQESEFEKEGRISTETFRLAGYKIGDQVSVEKDGKIQEGWRVDHFTTLPTKGRKEPAAFVVQDQTEFFDTIRLHQLNLTNPTAEFKAEEYSNK